MKNLIYLILGFLVALLFFLLFPFNVEAVTVKTNIKYSKSAPSSAALPKSKATKSANRTSGGLSVVEKIGKIFGNDAPLAIAIAKAESGLRPEAVGDGHLTYFENGIEYGMSCGVFQIRVLPGRPTCEELKNDEFNIKYAYGMYKAQGGFQAWSAYTNNSYYQFLNNL